jgi:hypothetical protein
MIFFALHAVAAPVWPTLSAAEQAELDAGEVVVKADTSEEKTVSTGLVKISADATKTWAAVLDFPSRVAETPGLVSVTEYKRNSAYDWFVRFEMNRFGIRAIIHDHWTCDIPQNWCSWSLDPGKESDLVLNDGWLMARPQGGVTYLAFHADLVVKQWVPGWVRRWLAVDSMENTLSKIRDRAQK